jgi:preprotein translocase subunit SecE
VARDRKRAKQRQQRRAQRGLHAAAGPEIHRADLPGALEHASGEVDEFDAALVRGAQGVPLPPEAPEVPLEPGGANGGAAEVPLEPGGANGGAAVAPAEDGGGAPPAAREAKQPLPRRAIAFLRASWAELQRVQWPDRRQVTQATAVVLGFVAVAGVYLGAADWIAQKIVNFIL